MSKEAIVIQKYNDMTREYQYSVKGYDITESIKNLLKLHKEAYDKENHSILEAKGWLEAQKFYEEKIKQLEHRLSNCIEPKFKQGDYFIEYWNETPNIYQYEGNKHFKCLNKKQGYHCDYVILGALLCGKDFIEQITEEEAKAKLREIQK